MKRWTLWVGVHTHSKEGLQTNKLGFKCNCHLSRTNHLEELPRLVCDQALLVEQHARFDMFWRTWERQLLYQKRQQEMIPLFQLHKSELFVMMASPWMMATDHCPRVSVLIRRKRSTHWYPVIDRPSPHVPRRENGGGTMLYELKT